MNRHATLTLSLLTLTLGVAHAQQEKTGLAVLPTPDGAYLRWYLPNDEVPAGGFSVQLEGPVSRQVTVTPFPPFEASLGVTKAEYDGLKNVYSAPATDENQRMTLKMINLVAVTRPEIARLLGISTTLKQLPAGRYTATIFALGKARTLVGQTTFTTGPSQPVAVIDLPKLSGSAGQLDIAWQRSNQPGDLTVGYNIYRSRNGQPFEKLTAKPILPNQPDRAGALHYTDSTTKAAGTYQYTVTGVDLFGREGAKSPPAVFTFNPVPLETPTVQHTSSVNGEVTLRWTRLKDPAVKGIVVLRGPTPETLQALDKLPAIATEYTDSTAESGKQYLYVLAPYDAQGDVQVSANFVSVIARDERPPLTPEGVIATAGPAAITLEWRAVPGVAGYRVYRYGQGQTAKEAIRLSQELQTQPTFTDQLQPGQTEGFEYLVTAVSPSQVESAASRPVAATLLDTLPPSTAALSADTTTGTIALKWQLPDDPKIAAFELQRATGDQAFTTIKQLTADQRTFTDSGTQPGLVYRYALVSLGKNGTRSPTSNIVKVALTVPDDTSAPADLDGKLVSGGAQLTWLPKPGQSYLVYRLTNGELVPVSGVLREATYLDAQGAAGTTYAVRTITSRGQLGELSAAITIR